MRILKTKTTTFLAKRKEVICCFYFLGEIGVFAMASLVPKNEQAGKEDHAEDDQHEQQDERAQPKGEGVQKSSCQRA